MRLIVLAAAALILFTSVMLLLQTKIQYRIGSKHLKILWLGMTLRKINLNDIKRISKRKPSRPAEYWYSTLKSKHRMLAIQRYGGIRKFVVITPRNRYIFLADLQNAIKRARPEANLENLIEDAQDTESETAAS